MCFYLTETDGFINFAEPRLIAFPLRKEESPDNIGHRTIEQMAQDLS